MSIERRLLWLLLVCAPLVWALGLGVSVNRAQHEVNELFDTEMIRLARQVQATMAPVDEPPPAAAGAISVNLARASEPLALRAASIPATVTAPTTTKAPAVRSSVGDIAIRDLSCGVSQRQVRYSLSD